MEPYPFAISAGYLGLCGGHWTSFEVFWDPEALGDAGDTFVRDWKFCRAF